VRKGKRQKAPGIDGISQDFFQDAWQYIHTDLLEVMQHMYMEGVIATQKIGTMVCIPKKQAPSVPEDYRFLTMLNADVKLLARIIAHRLNIWLPDILHPSQHCGISSTTILDTVSTIRDVMAHAETHRHAICILSLDLRAAFDQVSHQYMFELLARYGFDQQFQHRTRNLYLDAKVSIAVNGSLSSAIPIGCGVHQGCPLSMALFALVLNPFLCMLASTLPGVTTGRRAAKAAAIAYANDVTVFLSTPRDVKLLQDTIELYE
jgi:hypothetical protein